MATKPTIFLDSASDTAPVGDGKTVESTITLIGEGGIGETITILGSDFTSYGTALVDDDGKWEFTVTLPDGMYSFQAVAELNTESTEFSAPFELEVDAFIEQETPTLTLSSGSDSGVPGDLLTNDATPTFTGTGTFGATIELVNGFTSYGTAAVAEDGTWTITATSLPDGPISLSVISRAPGNDDLFSDPVALTIDTISPLAPTIALDAASDTGSSSSDMVTSNTQPTFTGAAEDGSAVTLYDTDGLPIGIGTASGGVWSITPTAALAEGAHSITACTVDAAGNESVASTALSVTVDTIAPTLLISSNVDSLAASETATITFTFSEDPGSSFTWDGSSGDVTVSGGTLSAISGSGLTRTATFTPDADTNVGTASITVAAGSYADAAGNIGGAGATPSLTFDTKLPDVPSTPDLAGVSDTGSSATDNITSDTTPTLTGTAEANSTVTVYNGATELGTTTADGSGNYAFTPVAALAAGSYSFSGTAEDAAGNVSAASSSIAVTIDDVSPTVVVDIEDGTLTRGDRVSNVTFTFSEVPIGFDAADITAVNGTISGLAATENPLVYTATFTSLAEFNGVASVSVGIGYGDEAGNIGTGGSDTVAVNTVTPPTTVPTDGSDNLIGTSGSDTIAGGLGNDTITAGLGNDVIFGNQGEDRLFGGQGVDIIYGGQDNDIIDGGEGDNTIFGGTSEADAFDGDDEIAVASGSNLVFANGGDDTVAINGNGDNTVYGGFGDDEITIGADSLSDGNNVVVGGQDGDTITITGDGDNTVYGGTGEVDTTDANDSITVTGNGDNRVFGNAGNDTLAVSGEGSNSIYGGLGADVISLAGGAAGGESLIVGGEGVDAITLSTAGDVTIFGGMGVQDTSDLADTIDVTLAGEGSATIYGNAGNDSIDVTIGGDATAVVYGGLGDDGITITDAVDFPVPPFTSLAAVAAEELEGPAAVVYGGEGKDEIDLSGFSGAATVYGGTGEVDPSDNDDVITTGTGPTVVFGNGGDDTIIVNGQATVYGGAGEDTFVLNTDADVVIGGFNFDEDTLDLSSFELDGGTVSTATPVAGTGNLVADLNNASSFTAGASDVTLVTLTGVGAGSYLIVDLNEDGAFTADADLVINITGMTGTLDGDNVQF